MEDGPGNSASKILSRILIAILMSNHHLNSND